MRNPTQLPQFLQQLFHEWSRVFQKTRTKQKVCDAYYSVFIHEPFTLSRNEKSRQEAGFNRDITKLGYTLQSAILELRHRTGEPIYSERYL